jgi:hypothetical protein
VSLTPYTSVNCSCVRSAANLLRCLSGIHKRIHGAVVRVVVQGSHQARKTHRADQPFGGNTNGGQHFRVGHALLFHVLCQRSCKLLRAARWTSRRG